MMEVHQLGKSVLWIERGSRQKIMPISYKDGNYRRF